MSTFSIPRDPLLGAGKAITILMQVVMAIAFVALLVAPVVMLFSRSLVEQQLAEGAISMGYQPFMSHVIPLVLLAAVVVGTIFLSARLMGQIIDTVGEGDPFVPENATRLARMGWLMLAGQGVLLIMLGIARSFIDLMPERTVHFEGGLDMGGIFLVIILFILARVFRKGTEMRDDLEGTV